MARIRVAVARRWKNRRGDKAPGLSNSAFPAPSGCHRCLTAACSFGEGKPCRYLTGDGPGDWEFAGYDFIMTQQGAEVDPGFGKGYEYDGNGERQAIQHLRSR